MVFEKHHGITDTLQTLGYTVERHTHREINTGLTNLVAGNIKKSHYLAIWIEFPISGMHIRSDRSFAHFSQLCSWGRLCADTSTPYVLFGSFGKKWSNPQLQTLVNDGRFYVAHH